MSERIVCYQQFMENSSQRQWEIYKEQQAEIKRLQAEIQAYNDRLNAIPTMCQPPQTAEDGLRFLAVWFDAMYPNDPDTRVQDDLRMWADEIERLRAALKSIASDNPNQVQTPTMLRTIAKQALAARAAGGGERE